jgi:hypothetical protein
MNFFNIFKFFKGNKTMEVSLTKRQIEDIVGVMTKHIALIESAHLPAKDKLRYVDEAKDIISALKVEKKPEVPTLQSGFNRVVDFNEIIFNNDGKMIGRFVTKSKEPEIGVPKP